MADALLSALLSVVMKKATGHVLQQFGVMWGIQEKLEKLERTLLAIQCILGDAEERQVKEPAVKRWLASLKDAAYEADDILDEFDVEAMRRTAEIQVDMMKKVRSFFSFHNPVLFRFKMGQKLNDIDEKIEEIANERNTFGFTITTQPQNRDRPQTHSYVIESEVIGREKEKEKIVKLLLDNDDNQNVAVLPIVGMGGLGKTTLAQLIYKDERVENYFQPCIWVCVSDEFDVAKLAKAIIASATGVECELSNMELLQRRLREVVRGKRYLLVLDDVWNEDRSKWNELKILLGTGGEGSRIIVTTRSERASSIMGTLGTYHLPYLTEDDSWTLFRKKAFEEGAEEDQNLVSIGKEIVKKCGGLPLAVNTLGGLMHSKSQEMEWLSVRDSEIWDMQFGENGILPALRLSYCHLPSHVKQCFAFCAIFPKDYEMEKDLLIQLWMANGFIPSDGRKELEDKGLEIFNELAWKSFFQDIEEVEYSYPERHEHYCVTVCKMHDLMHDLAQSIMGNECLIMSESARWEEVSKDTRHLCTSAGVPWNLHRIFNDCPIIRTLLSSLHKMVHTLITLIAHTLQPKSLRVLDLHNTDITHLPIAIGYLKHLRYLDLSGSDIIALPDDIITLFNLQTLKLSNCLYLRKLPKDMRNMSSLRHLYIDKCKSLKYMPAGMGQIKSLRILTMYIVGNDSGRGIGELNGLNLGGLLELYNLRNVRDASEARHANMGSKQSLRSLILCWDMTRWNPPYCYAESAHHCFEENVLPVENAEEVLEFLRPHGGLKLLAIWRYGGGSFPTWMMDSPLLQNLVEIHMGVCTGCEHLPPLWQLPFLKFLYLIKMDRVKYICSSTIYGNDSNGTVQAFPSLERLVLHTMQSLEEWLEDEGTTKVTLVFPHLAELKIINCPNLMIMPELPSLKSLEMEGTNKQLGLVCSMTTLSSLNIEAYKTSNGTESPPLDQKKMSLRYFTSLEDLAITASEDLAPMLEKEEETRGLRTSLHNLSIINCNYFFSPSQQSTSPLGFWKNLSSLLSLRMNYCDDLVYWPEEEFRSLNSLKKIDIDGCNKLVGPSPLPLSSSLDGELLPNLEELDIVRCDGLLELPKLPASLRQLCVHDCPKFNSLTEGLRHATALESVDILGCPSLTSLPVDLGHLTALTSMLLFELPGLKSLPQGLGQLAALRSLYIVDCSKLSSLPEGMQGLTSLQDLSIKQCPRLSSLPEGLEQRLPGLQWLVIEGCPNLERLYKRGGPNWHLVSRIPYTEILSERRTISTFLPSFPCFGRPSKV